MVYKYIYWWMVYILLECTILVECTFRFRWHFHILNYFDFESGVPLYIFKIWTWRIFSKIGVLFIRNAAKWEATHFLKFYEKLFSKAHMSSKMWRAALLNIYEARSAMKISSFSHQQEDNIYLYCSGYLTYVKPK